MFDALLLVGLLVMPVGVVLLGFAMRRDPAFGKVAGNVSVALGVVGLAAATVMLIDPLSVVAAFGVFALIGLPRRRMEDLPALHDRLAGRN